MNHGELRDYLESRYQLYHTEAFIDTDPLQIPHRFNRKEDIEISGFLTATIAWGQRATIIKSARKLMHLMDDAPHDFLTTGSHREWDRFQSFVHRTFQPADIHYFLDALRRIYVSEGGLESVFQTGYQGGGVFESICHFREVFLQWSPLIRSRKHVSDPARGSAAKRLNLFLMWMCRIDSLKIHFGLWKGISPSELIIPLDVHVGRVARDLGLLKRKQNDWRAASELTERLRIFDASDPTRFDFSLFGIGLFEKK